MFYILLCVTLCLSLFCNHLDGEERAGWFALFAFLVSRDCCVALPNDAMGLSAVYDCGISWSYSLTILESMAARTAHRTIPTTKDRSSGFLTGMTFKNH